MGFGRIGPSFLTSALDEDWSASRPDSFTLGERAAVTIGLEVGGFQNASEHCEAEKNLSSLQGIEQFSP
jgi:hypothetical protein